MIFYIRIVFIIVLCYVFYFISFSKIIHNFQSAFYFLLYRSFHTHIQNINLIFFLLFLSSFSSNIFFLPFSYLPCVDAFDGNEYCAQSAIAKLLLCCNVQKNTYSTTTNTATISTIYSLNDEKYRNSVTKYFDFSTHFILSFRIYITSDERKKDSSFINNLSLSLSSTDTNPYSNRPLSTMTILLQKFPQFCPKHYRSFTGKIEKFMPYVLVHSDSTDASLGKQKQKKLLTHFPFSSQD